MGMWTETRKLDGPNQNISRVRNGAARRNVLQPDSRKAAEEETPSGQPESQSASAGLRNGYSCSPTLGSLKQPTKIARYGTMEYRIAVQESHHQFAGWLRLNEVRDGSSGCATWLLDPREVSWRKSEASIRSQRRFRGCVKEILEGERLLRIYSIGQVYYPVFVIGLVSTPTGVALHCVGDVWALGIRFHNMIIRIAFRRYLYFASFFYQCIVSWVRYKFSDHVSFGF